MLGVLEFRSSVYIGNEAKAELFIVRVVYFFTQLEPKKRKEKLKHGVYCFNVYIVIVT